ncbi:MAG: hypothetical protein ACPGVU_12710 [Limisphaerales bacterium]
MDAFRFQDPQGGTDGVTWQITLRPSEPDLQWQDLREIVADVLLAGDGLDYKIGDFVVLPDRLIALVGLYPGRILEQQSREWITTSAARIDECRERKGDFWKAKTESERIRDWDDFDARRKALRRAPREAGIRVGEFYLHVHDDE